MDVSFCSNVLLLLFPRHLLAVEQISFFLQDKGLDAPGIYRSIAVNVPANTALACMYM